MNYISILFLLGVSCWLLVACETDTPIPKESTPPVASVETVSPEEAQPSSPPMLFSMASTLEKNWNLISFPVETTTPLASFSDFDR